jgi:hypothetical protein
LKSDVNVFTVRKKGKNLKEPDQDQDPEPSDTDLDPYQNVTDPEHCLKLKIAKRSSLAFREYIQCFKR